MNHTKTRGRDPDGTRRSALDAAQRLFAEKGFAGASMREIAAISGVSQPLIHYHFGSKKGLFRAVKQRLIASIRAMLPASGDSSSNDVDMPEIIRSMYSMVSNNEDLMRLVAWSHLEGERDPWPGEEDLSRATADHIRRRQSDGSMRKDIDPLITTVMIGALIFYWCENRHYYAGLFEEPLETFTERYLNQVFDLLFQDAAPRRQ